MTTSSDESIELPADLGSGGADATGVAAEDRSLVADLRRQLRAERERSLNATDRVLGAQAEAAQARAEIKELQYRLHVRETELAQAKELLSQREASSTVDGGPAGAAAARIRDGLAELTVRVRNR